MSTNSANQASFCLLAPQASFCLLSSASAQERPNVQLQLTDLTKLKA
jgi:hypothetical protein